jgi:hypothetical protein
MTFLVMDRAAPNTAQRSVVDLITFDGTKRETLANGMLRIRDCTLALADNVQTYLAGELGLTDRPASALVRVYRPPEEVFAPDSMASFASVAVTDDHPAGGVTADNADQVSRGWSSESVRQVGDHLVADLLISSRKLIDKVAAGKSELSNGYAMRLEWKAGTSPKGETYDAIMRSITGNHIAVVDAGRCGGSCRVSDKAPPQVSDCCPSCQSASHKKEGRVSDVQLKTVTLDGLPIQTTDAGEAAINMLKGKLEQAATALTTADAKFTTDKAALDATIARLTQELADAQAKIPTADQLAGMIATRAKLLGDAARLAPAIAATLADKADDEVRKLAITAKLGDAMVTGKDQAWLNVAFDMAVANLGTDPAAAAAAATPGHDALAAALSTGPAASSTGSSAADAAWAENNTHLQNAWMGDTKGAA